MKAVNIYLFFLFWAGVAHAGSKADNPSFMMVSGISAADEMCLTAADGTRGQIYDCLLKLLCRVRVQEASALMVQQWFWSLALLLSQRGMAGNFGSSTRELSLMAPCKLLVKPCCGIRLNTNIWKALPEKALGGSACVCLWRQRLPDGQIANAMGKKCVGADGNAVVLMACDGGSIWEAQGNGT